MTKQLITLSCKTCRISYKLFHELDSPATCDVCGEVMYNPHPKQRVWLEKWVNRFRGK